MAKLAKLCQNKLKLARSTAQPPPPPRPPEELLLRTPLRIVHAGGAVESYYMALPAARIMEKYPRAVLARPEVFHRPWQSVVGPEEILPLGEKFYLVPRGTVRKLQLRSRRPASLRQPGGTESEGETTGSRPPVPPRQQLLWRKRVQFIDTWQPSLVAIEESSVCNM